MRTLASLWCLDPAVDYLNHGSFGACPSAVLAVQADLRLELEREPVDFLVAKLPQRLNAAREALAGFLGAAAEDLVFISNATAGVNAVLRSLDFAPGDEILITNLAYGAVAKAARFVAARTGARLVEATIPLPLADPDTVIERVAAVLSPRVRLAVFDHIASTSALVLPVVQLTALAKKAGARVLIDGAHAPGKCRSRCRQSAPIGMSAIATNG